ncbi:MAG: hypothetical protein AAGH40_05920 [Verrucomicrobiota bacterium]
MHKPSPCSREQAPVGSSTWRILNFDQKGAEPNEALSLIEASSVSTKEKEALRQLVEDVSVGE